MNYENEHLILDYLDDYYKIINDEFSYFGKFEFCHNIINSITKIYNLNKELVEFIISGWAIINGMTANGLKNSKNHILMVNNGISSLRATWSPELAQDISAYHNIDAEAELTAILSEQVASEVDRLTLGFSIEEFTHRRSMMSRYATKVINPNYYGIINIDGIDTNNNDDTINNIRWEDYFRPKGPYDKAQVAKFLEENGYGGYKWGRFGILRLVPKETIQHYSEPTFTWSTHIFHKRFDKGFEWWERKREGTNSYVGGIEDKISWKENSSHIINGHTNRWEPLVVGDARGRENLFTEYTRRSWIG